MQKLLVTAAFITCIAGSAGAQNMDQAPSNYQQPSYQQPAYEPPVSQQPLNQPPAQPQEYQQQPPRQPSYDAPAPANQQPFMQPPEQPSEGYEQPQQQPQPSYPPAQSGYPQQPMYAPPNHASASQPFCQPYKDRFSINQEERVTRGMACLRPDGAWELHPQELGMRYITRGGGLLFVPVHPFAVGIDYYHHPYRNY